jgi:hypothetical protein
MSNMQQGIAILIFLFGVYIIIGKAIIGAAIEAAPENKSVTKGTKTILILIWPLLVLGVF